ncbi:hypothetical protein Goklo_005165 [Gossypium klotzschianum]|uniref:PGG domain-containing protein n=1 Tax=Gossypium klotzschianum TaxID=34286 RepID=A0A7J8VR53_9ROSI|nr:hypothetical protein [Gossypium klotzschianum]
MEMMKLKPSFARKLNQQYLSPLHLAVRKGHRRMVLHFLEIDKDLIHAKGKNGNTPLHIISEVGNNNGLLDRFLKICPQSIRAVTIKNRNALHIAVENDRPDVLQVLIQTLRKTDYYCEVMNQKASLSPPGGVWQGDNTSKSKGSDDSTIIGNQSWINLVFFISIFQSI